MHNHPRKPSSKSSHISLKDAMYELKRHFDVPNFAQPAVVPALKMDFVTTVLANHSTNRSLHTNGPPHINNLSNKQIHQSEHRNILYNLVQESRKQFPPDRNPTRELQEIDRVLDSTRHVCTVLSSARPSTSRVHNSHKFPDDNPRAIESTGILRTSRSVKLEPQISADQSRSSPPNSSPRSIPPVEQHHISIEQQTRPFSAYYDSLLSARAHQHRQLHSKARDHPLSNPSQPHLPANHHDRPPTSHVQHPSKRNVRPQTSSQTKKGSMPTLPLFTSQVFSNSHLKPSSLLESGTPGFNRASSLPTPPVMFPSRYAEDDFDRPLTARSIQLVSQHSNAIRSARQFNSSFNAEVSTRQSMSSPRQSSKSTLKASPQSAKQSHLIPTTPQSPKMVSLNLSSAPDTSVTMSTQLPSTSNSTENRYSSMPSTLPDQFSSSNLHMLSSSFSSSSLPDPFFRQSSITHQDVETSASTVSTKLSEVLSSPSSVPRTSSLTYSSVVSSASASLTTSPQRSFSEIPRDEEFVYAHPCRPAPPINPPSIQESARNGLKSRSLMTVTREPLLLQDDDQIQASSVFLTSLPTARDNDDESDRASSQIGQSLFQTSRRHKLENFDPNQRTTPWLKFTGDPWQVKA